MSEKPSVSPAPVARLAYSIWESEGRPPGRALEHWLRAEAELAAKAAAPARRSTAKKAVAAKSKKAAVRKKTASKPSGARPRTRRPHGPSSSP